MFSRVRYLILALLLLFISVPSFSQDSLNVTMLSSTLVNWGSVSDVETYGDYTFIACRETGIKVLDFTDPDNVAEINKIVLDSYFIEIDEASRTLYAMEYLTSESSRVHAYNIAEPESIIEMGVGTINHFSDGFYVSNNILFSESPFESFSLMDVSSPSTMNVYANVSVPNPIVDSRFSNGFAYIITAWKLYIYDCTNPSDNHLVHEEELNEWCNTSRLDVLGDYLYIYEDKSLPDNNSFLKIYDITNPSTPVRRSTTPVTNWPLNLKVIGDYAFVLCRTTDDHSSRFIDIYNVSNPSIPVYTGSYEDETIFRIWPSENFLALRKLNGPVEFLDYSDINSMQLVHSFDHNGGINDLTVNSNQIFIADDEGGLMVYDISDETSPARVVQYDFDGFQPTTIVSHDGLIYASDTNQLKILDFTDMDSPVEVAVIDHFENGINLFDIYGDRLYLMVGGSIHFYDISDPSSLVELSNIQVSGSVRSFATIEDHLYVYSSFHVLTYSFYYFSIIDISDMEDPILLLEREDLPTLTALATDGQYLYCGSGICGGPNYLVYDVSEPESMFLLNSLELPNGITEATIHEEYAYVTTKYDGLSIVNIENPNDLSIDGFYHTPGHGRDIEIYENMIVAGDYYYLDILDFEYLNSFEENPDPVISDFKLSAAYPNPFNSTVRFNVTVPSESELRIKVYNLLGEEVADLHSGITLPGTHIFSWKADLSTGIYFLEVSNNTGWRQVQKVIFQK